MSRVILAATVALTQAAQIFQCSRLVTVPPSCCVGQVGRCRDLLIKSQLLCLPKLLTRQVLPLAHPALGDSWGHNFQELSIALGGSSDSSYTVRRSES